MLTNDVDGIPDMGRVWTLDLSELTMEAKPFARGAFGHVHKGEYFGTPVCIKVLKNEDPNERENSFKLIKREVTSMKFGHPNLVQFMGAAEKGDEIYIITEYIHGGNLRQYLKDERVNIPWPLRTQIGKDIACGMAYLHSKGIIHRDLKSKNLLVGDNWRIKICDFGFARSVSRRQLMTVCGTGEWMAPEVLQGVDYDEKADVYSFGIVLCELITRRKATDDLPRSHLDFSLDVAKLMPLVPEDCPPALINLAISCVAYDSHARPPFTEITRTLKAMLASLTPVPTSHPRPSSYSLLCSSTGAPPNPNATPIVQQMQRQQYYQQYTPQHTPQHTQQQQTQQQTQVTSNNGPTKERTHGRAHAATSPPPLANTHQQINNFNNNWGNDHGGDGFVNVTSGSAPSRGLVWSDNWEAEKPQQQQQHNNNPMGPLFVSNRLNPGRKQTNGSSMITPSNKNKKDKDFKSPPPSPPPILFSSSTPPTLISFSSPPPPPPTSSSIPSNNQMSTSTSTTRPHAPTIHSFSPHPSISPAAYATAQFHLLNTSSHSTRSTNAPHLAAPPPKLHEKFTTMGTNALAMSR